MTAELRLELVAAWALERFLTSLWSSLIAAYSRIGELVHSRKLAAAGSFIWGSFGLSKFWGFKIFSWRVRFDSEKLPKNHTPRWHYFAQ